MAITPLEVDEPSETSVWLGNREMTRAAGELHLFGVLLGAHTGRVGFVSAEDVAGLPYDVRAAVHELVEDGMWAPAVGGYTIDPVQAARAMRAALDRLNDPALCTATGSAHVRDHGRCRECGADLVSAFA